MNSRPMVFVVALLGLLAQACGYEEGEIAQATQALTPRRELAMAYDRAADAGTAPAGIAHPRGVVIAATNDWKGLLVADINYDSAVDAGGASANIVGPSRHIVSAGD